jgi:hypothetical protein
LVNIRVHRYQKRALVVREQVKHHREAEGGRVIGG